MLCLSSVVYFAFLWILILNNKLFAIKIQTKYKIANLDHLKICFQLLVMQIQELLEFPQMHKWTAETIHFIQCIDNEYIRNILLQNYESYMVNFEKPVSKYNFVELINKTN